MRRDNNQQKIALAVGIALSAGMFSIMPVAYGAPTGGIDKTGGASISYTATQYGKDTDISSTITNNVIDWQDFSVAQGENVNFDGKNYLNIVSGQNTSQIDGAINSENGNIYLVNPNGVIFGQGSSVDVGTGSLVASTRYLNSDIAAAQVDKTTNPTNNIPDIISGASSTVASDIVNMGSITANSVVLDGNNIRFMNSGTTGNVVNVTNNDITFKASGEVHIGNTDGETVSNYNINGKKISSYQEVISNSTNQDEKAAAQTEIDNIKANSYYKLINSLEEISSTGNYMLSGNIALPSDDNTTYNGYNGTFSGKIDGMGFTISGLKSTVGGGLFKQTSGATIENIRVVNPSVTGGTDDTGAASIAGIAGNNTVIRDVAVTGGTIAGPENFIGGIVGKADGVTLTRVACETTVNGSGGGLVGYVTSGNNYITNSYFAGTAKYGFVQDTFNDGDSLNIVNSYAVYQTGAYTAKGSIVLTNSIAKPKSDNSLNYKELYDSVGWDITSTGGVNIDKTTGAVTRPTWRIYEGQATPILTSQLKGVTTVSYDYAHGSQSGKNYVVKTDSAGNEYKVGADLTATSPVKITNSDNTTSDGVLTYNGSYMNVDENTLNYGGGANTSLISYSETGDTGVRNAKTKALFHSGQDGYDIVGGNVTMAKRQVTVKGADLDFSHVYNGGTDVTEEFKEAFSASAGTGTAGGILADDADYVKIGYDDNFSAKFLDKNVGVNKSITLTGGLTLETNATVSGAEDILDNYVLAESSSDLSTTTATGSITARPIYLIVTKPTDDRLNKTYDGTNTVNSTVSASSIFSLDATPTYAVGTQTPGYGKITDDKVSLAVGTSVPTYVDVDDAGNVTNDNAVNAGGHKIKFSGIELTGDDAKNYKLQYQDTKTDVKASQAFVDGVIRPRLLASDGFQVKTQTGVDTNNNPIYEIKAANKVYDGTSLYKVPDNAVLVANTAGTDSNTGVIAADTNNLWFKLSSDTTKKSYFMDSSNAETDMAAGDKAAVKVAYAVDVATKEGYSALKGNYTFDEATANGTVSTWKTLNNDIPDVTGDGTISRRAITVAANGVTGIDRDYNGTANVEGAAYTEMGGQYLKYDANTAYKLLKDDSVSATATPPVTDNADWNITAAYSDKNVARNADGSVADKTVNFTIAITGSDAVNYTLNGVNAEDASVTLTGKGKIKPKTITPVFQDISKTYNGTNQINDSDAASVTLSTVGLVTGLTYKNDNNEDVTDDVSLAFSSGHSEADAYYVSADYNGNAGENLDVYYPYLTLAGDDKVNYDLSTTTGEGKGTINRRLILSDSFTVNGGEATKVYDGNEYYTLPDGATLTSAAGESGNTGVITADQPYLHFALSDTENSTYFTKADGTTPAKKVADAKKIKYAVNATTDTGYEYLLGNYKLGTVDSATNLDNASTGLSVSGDGHITRRELSITAENATGIDKPYDTNEAVLADYTGMGNKVKYADNSLKLVENDGTAWNINASYNGADVYRENGVVIDNGKEVTFTAYLSGDAVNNYTINGKNAENYTTSHYELPQKGHGKIIPLTITPVFKTITKTYTGMTEITDGNAYITVNENEKVNVKDFTENDSRLYSLPENLDGNKVTLTYSTDVENAYYDGAGVGAHTITYKGLALVGDKSGNYELSANTITGNGQINKAKIGMSDLKFTFAGVTREYNGDNTAVGDDIAAGFVTDAYIDFGDGNNAVKFNYTGIDSAVYSSPGTGTSVAGAGTNKNVTYTISGITVPDSVLANFEWDNNDPFTSSKAYTINGVGTITPKKVYATVNGPVTKPYDATPDVKNGDANQLLTGESLVHIEGLVTADAAIENSNATSAVYIDSSPNAGDAANYGIENKSVKYTVKLNDAIAGNYVIYDDDSYTTLASESDKFTTHNNTINQRDLKLTFNPVTKVYDGYTNYGNSTVVNNLPAYVFDPDNLQPGDTLIVADGYTANASYNSANVKEAATVTYDKLTITGNDAANYRLLDKDGNVMTADAEGQYTTTGKGTISKYQLNSAPTITFEHVNKEYDGTNAVIYSRVPSENDPRKFINATVGTGDNAEKLGFDLVSAPLYTGGSSVNSDDGEHIRTGGAPNEAQFTIKFSSDNYEFSNINDPNFTKLTDGSYQYSATYNNATITPRKVYVALKGDTDISKVYDGGTKLENADLAAIRIANQEIYIPDASDILSDDKETVHIDWAGIQAEYTGKDAAPNIDVKYTISLTNNAAGNYVLYKYAENPDNATQITDTNKLTGKGAITKATFTIEPVLLEKTYNGSALIGQNGTANGNANWSAGNLVFKGVTPEGGSQETFTLSNEAFAKVTGQYGTGAGDANVSWSGDEVAYKDVYLKGLAAAMELMAGDEVAKNYTLANSAYADGTALFKATAGKGRINPVDATVNKEWVPVTREYDRTESLVGVKGIVDGQDKTVQDILKLTINDVNGNPLKVAYEAIGQYNGANKGDAHTLTYTITDGSVSNKVWDGSGYNYRIEASALNGQTLTSDNNNQITSRTLNVITDDVISKVYDGKTDVEDADKKAIHFSAKDEELLAKDNVFYNVDVNYADKNANVGNTDTRINVPYTITLSGNTLENYKLSDANLNEVSGTTVGDITKRPVYVVAQNVTGLDRDYRYNNEGKPDDLLPDDFNSADNHFALLDPTADSGLVANAVTDDSDISLNVQNVTGRYASPHVQRENDGKVKSQEIIFSGFALGDDSIDEVRKNNYTFAGEVKGSGMIKPLPITVDIKKAPTKEYDGLQTLSETYAANTNLTPVGLLGTDNANIIIKKAEYDNANAGTNKAYTYDIELGNGDYSLTQGANSPKITVSSYGTKGVISANDGTIDQRLLTPSVIKNMTKEYDGTLDGTENAAAHITIGSRVVNNDNVGLSVKAVYDNPNAGKSEDSDELQEHKVKYTLNLSNPNYKLAQDTMYGTGTISRKGLNIVATPVSINNGEVMPKFSGTVEGLVSGDDNLASSFVFESMPNVTSADIGTNPIYGWYRNQTQGNFGLNYTFAQDPANATAFTVNYVDSGRNNPDTKVTPTSNIYQQISKDKGSGFGDNAAAALEYVDKNGQVIARETIDSGEIHDGGASIGNADDMTSQDTSLANIGIVGGDIVNVDGADAANMANIEVTDNGTTVNLEITSLSSGESGDKQAVAEITSVPAAADNSSAQIQNLDDRQDILEQITNKAEEQEKEGEIAIESKSSQNDDEIELTIEGNGVNVA